MFLCDVAMGKVYEPTRGGNGKRPGYDSCFAKPGTLMGSGKLLNNEMIVYSVDQAKLDLLCEFDL